MRETIDFRIPESNARGRLPKDAGERLGTSVRRILASPGDPLFAEIRRLDYEFRSRGDVFFTGGAIRRVYSAREMEEAELFHVRPKRAFEPAGEECGTAYDETKACREVFKPASKMRICGHTVPSLAVTCGAGARQVTPLFLDGRRIPRKVDFSMTIAEELVVSARVVEVFREKGLRGADFQPVRLSNKRGEPSRDHFQLKVLDACVEIHPSTRAGGSLFDESGYGRCPRGHTVGLNLLSEVIVWRSSVLDGDFTAAKQLVGARQGLLRPGPILLISPRAWRVIDSAKLKGLIVEVARLS